MMSKKNQWKLPKSFQKPFSKLYKITKGMIYSYWIITRRRRLWVHFRKGGKAYSKEKPVIGNIPVPKKTRSYNAVVVYIENGIFILVSEIGFDRCVDDSDFYFGNYLTPFAQFFHSLLTLTFLRQLKHISLPLSTHQKRLTG
jgi:hypothetical protein